MKKQISFFCFLILLNFIFVFQSFSQNAWIQKANFGGTARQGAVGFSIGNSGYIGTGYTNTNTSDFWKYNPNTNTWTQKASFPVVLRYASSFVISGKAYVVGGIVSGPPYNTSLYMYDPTTNSWTIKAPFPGTGIYGGAAFSIGTKGYFGMGNTNTANGPYTSQFYAYSSTTDSWTQVASFPGIARYGEYGIAVNGKGYVGFGGTQTSGVVDYNDWYEYDPGDDVWTQKASCPGTERAYTGGFAINNKVYIGTGRTSSGGYLGDFFEYDPSTNTWTQKPDYGGGNAWLVSGFSINNVGYMGTGNFVSNLNSFWQYNDLMSLSVTLQNVTCFGGSNGSATVTPSGGTPPYTYNWSDGQTTATATNLSAGAYSCTVTDATSSSGSINISIIQPSEIVLTLVPTNPSCGNLYGSIDMTVSGGTAPYTYSWSNGATTEDLSNLPAGNYAVTVTDGSGCISHSATDIVVITCGVPTNITSSAITDVSGKITWTGNSCAVKYRVQIRVQGTTTWSTFKVTAPTSSKTITALTPNTTYEYRVRTDCNTAGTIASAYSTIQTFTTLCDCALPTGLTVSPISQTSATINWTGNACAYRYRLQYRKSSTTTWTTKLVTAPITTKVLTGLTANTVYEYQIRTECDGGSYYSDYTAIQTFTTSLRLEDLSSDILIIDVSVFPNPSNGKFLLDIHSLTNEVAGIKVTNILGQEILNSEISLVKGENQFNFSLDNISNGILIIEIKTSAGIINRKLTIAK